MWKYLFWWAVRKEVDEWTERALLYLVHRGHVLAANYCRYCAVGAELRLKSGQKGSSVNPAEES